MDRRVPPESIQYRDTLNCGNKVTRSHLVMPRFIRLKRPLPSTISLLEGLTARYITRI